MSTPEVVLQLEGGYRLRFTERALCVAGRAADCQLIVTGDSSVSRHHCLFDVNPPGARLRDFGSLNGTRLNGVKIGQRDAGLSPEDARERQTFASHDLCDGDEVRLGDAIVRVTLPRAAPPPVPAAAQRDDPRAALAGNDRYEIVRELDRGGMGAVYLAHDRARGGAQVAVKVMLPELAVDSAATARFLREIDNTRALRHENIVAFHDAGTSGRSLFLAVEYCDGGSVQDLVVRRGGRLAPAEATAICCAALDGLAHAHEAVVPHVELADGNIAAGRGVIHRDIKPQNILLAGGVAKLADFGLSKALDKAGLTRNTRTGMVAGTPVFMARRQLIDYRYAGPEVDVWSVAAALYYLLTGAAPRNFAPRSDPYLVVLEQDAVPIRHRRDDIPAPLADVIDRALRENGAPAFATAAALGDALASSRP